MLIADIVVYIAIILVFAFFVWRNVEIGVYFVIMWTIACVCLFSVRHIIRLAKPLKKQGIHADHRIMAWFSIISLLTVVCLTISLGLMIVYKTTEWPDNST